MALCHLFFPSATWRALAGDGDPIEAISRLSAPLPWQQLLDAWRGAIPIAFLQRRMALPNPRAVGYSEAYQQAWPALSWLTPLADDSWLAFFEDEATACSDAKDQAFLNDRELARKDYLAGAEILAYAGCAAAAHLGPSAPRGNNTAQTIRRERADDRTRLANWCREWGFDAPRPGSQIYVSALSFVQENRAAIEAVAKAFAQRNAVPTWCGKDRPVVACAPRDSKNEHRTACGDVLRTLASSSSVEYVAKQLLKPNGQPYSPKQVRRVISGEQAPTQKMIEALLAAIDRRNPDLTWHPKIREQLASPRRPLRDQ